MPQALPAKVLTVSRTLFLSYFLLLSPAAFAAVPLESLSTLKQATLTVATVPPGATATLDGTPVPVTADGKALLAVGQFDKKPVTLKISIPDGQVIRRTLAITPRKWDIQKISGLPGRMVNPPKDVLARIARENAELARARLVDTPKAYFASGFQPPATGRITGIFGSARILNGEIKSPHRGVDYAGRVGAPVFAAADGVVRLAHPDMYYTGQTVLIDHGHTLSTVYVHLSKTLVHTGQKVHRGEKIGEIGATGRATGPHLHWGATLGRVHIDPLTLLNVNF